MVREWLVFFGNGPPGWWRIFTRPDFRHVAAAGCDAELNVWVFYDPSLAGTMIEVLPYGDKAELMLSGYLANSRHVLRMKPRAERRLSPMVFACVAAIKALLGVRCRSLTPHGLYRDLIGLGAEIVEVAPVGTVRHPVTSARGPGDAQAAPGSASAGGERSARYDPAKTTARHAAP